MKKLFLSLSLILLLTLTACGGDEITTAVEDAASTASEAVEDAASVVEDVVEDVTDEVTEVIETVEKEEVVEVIPGAMIDTSRYYRLTSMFMEPEGRCLESNGGPNDGSVLGGATFMNDCQNVTGQIWLFTPSEAEGYYHMTSVFMDEQGNRLESNGGPNEGSVLGGATFINSAQNVTGQFWKLIESEEDGYYHLTSMFMEDGGCLESNGGPNEDSVLGGATFIDSCQNAIGQFWKLVAEEVTEETEPQVVEVPQTGSVTGQVTDAVNGNPIAGSQVCIQGTAQCADTNENGNYTISDVAPGELLLSVQKDTYIPVNDHAMTVMAGEVTNQSMAMSPELAAGEIRIVLTWGASPSDLDSYFWYPSSTSPIYYNNKGPVETAPRLDLDDTTAEGPETITIPQQEDGTYSFVVKNHSQVGTMEESNAIVRVYQGDREIASYSPPAGEGIWWHVFDMDGQSSALTEVSALSAASPK